MFGGLLGSGLLGGGILGGGLLGADPLYGLILQVVLAVLALVFSFL